MKKTMIAAITAAFAALAISCDKRIETVPPLPGEGLPVHLTFGSADNFTRAFFDNTVPAERWEKMISKLSVYIHDADGKQVMRKHFSREEISAMHTDFVVPDIMAGKTLTFYAVANMPPQSDIIPDDVTTLSTESLYDYTVYYGIAATRAARDDGFAMTGRMTATIHTDGTVTPVSIVLKRTVAKIFVQIDIDPTFSQRHRGGIVWVQGITVESKAIGSALFFNDYAFRHADHSATYTYSQMSSSSMYIPGARYSALFYVYEQGPPTYGPDEKVRLKIKTQYSQDPNWVSDRIEHDFIVELEGSGGGEIRRNGYYHIHGMITDFDALHTRSAVMASDWEVPATADLGNITITQE